MKKSRIFHSAIQAFYTCGYRFYLHWIKYRNEPDKRSPSPLSSHIGSAAHKTIQANMQCKIKHGHKMRLSADAIENIAREAFRKRVKYGVHFKASERDEPKVAIQRSEDLAVQLSLLHWEQVAPDIRPMATEEKWVLEINDCIYDISGVFDLIEGNPETDEPTRIRDTKTAGKSPGKFDADLSDQLTLYHLAALRKWAKPLDLAQDYLVKTKKPKYVQQVTSRTSKDHGTVLARMANFSECIQRGTFSPAPQDSWVCSEDYCGYTHECPYFRRISR